MSDALFSANRHLPGMLPHSTEELARSVEPPAVRPPEWRRRAARVLLPPAVSARHAIFILILGFAFEAATEGYQLLERGNLVQGLLEYYTTLATTIFGFYLMFLGLREWHAFHPKPSSRRSVPYRAGRLHLDLALWTGGTAMTAVLSFAWPGGATATTPDWIAWPVGGVVVLAFGRFFFDLSREAQLLGSTWGDAFGWSAFVWSLGVATVAGLVTGDRIVLLLTEFVTDWVSLVASVGPVVVAMSPLLVTYALLIGAFWPGLRRPRKGIS